MSGYRLRTLGWGAALLAVGVVLCQVPLFNLLAYEFCFVLGLSASLAGAHLGAAAVWTARTGAARSDGEEADAHPLLVVGGLYARATARTWALLILPLAAISLNALRVRNCDFAGGLVWFALLPMLSAACGVAAGVGCALVRPFRRRVVPTLLALAVVPGSVLWAVGRFYAAPPIFAYDPFGGYFPGTLYDEAVAVGAPLLWARAWHLSVVAAVLLVGALFLDGHRFALRAGAARGRGRLVLAALLALALAGGLRNARAQLGIQLDADDVARALGATRETAHFYLHYAPGGPFAKDIALYAEDHEFRYAQLKALLGVEPAGKIDAYLFASADEKQRLMGAAHTFIAKPWRREIYLQADGWPHPVLMHELAHVFGGCFGDSIFGVSRRGLRLNVGLIEGLAVAASFRAEPLTPHQMVKSMRVSHNEPPLARVMSMGFLGLNAAQAYNVAGSFCRFLLEKYGAAKLEQIFHAAGAEESWREIYGADFATLAADWSHFIDGVELPVLESELERERLKRPSVFHKVCAHELALQRDAAHRAAAQGFGARALAALSAVCAEDPDDPSNFAEVMDAASAAELPSEAAEAARKLLAHPKISPALAARAHALLGDLAWQQGELPAARAEYAEALKLPLDEGSARLVTVKELATREPPGPVAEGLQRFLVPVPPQRDPALDLLNVAELARAQPDRALFHYLFARQLEPRGRFAEAARELEAALAAKEPLPDARFVREALKLLGRSYYRAGHRSEARATFLKLTGDPFSLEAADWIARCDFQP